MEFNIEYFERIRSVLKNYIEFTDKKVLDAHFEILKIKKMYSDTYTENYFMKNEIRVRKETIETINKERGYATHKIENYLSLLRAQLSLYVNATVDEKFLSKLQAIKLSGIKIEKEELEIMLKESRGDYLPMKILSELAQSSGLNMVNAPSVGLFEKDLANIEKESYFLLNNYCGSKTEWYDLLPQAVDAGKIMERGMDKAMCVNADCVLLKNSTLDIAIEHWGNMLPLIEEKKELTEEETKALDEMYIGFEDDLERRTQTLLLLFPEVRKKLLLSKKYKEFVPKQ